MKDITNVTKINEFFAQNGQIEYPKWVELSKEHFSESFKKECQHLIDTFESAAAKKDRHAYAFAYGNYREWIEAARTSIMNCMKRDCNNMSKHFGIELDVRLGRGLKNDWYGPYVEDVVNPVLSTEGLFRETIDTYNRLILPMARAWARASQEERKRLCGEA